MKRSLILRRMGQWVLIGAATVLLTSSVFGSDDFKPVFKPTLDVSRTSGQINIDGELNDPGWKSAAGSNHFVERYPGDMTQPAVETEFLITYDDENLYVAFICHDNPADIRATMCQRDQFEGDDAVCVLLDAFGDATRAYELLVNPYGVQKDRLWTSVAGEDESFDLIWQSAAKVTDIGYQVEIAVPFTSLRFPNKDVQTWKMDFWRRRAREGFMQYSWAAYDRNEQCWVCQWGTIAGIQGVHPGKGIEILPAYVANQSGNLPYPSQADSGFSDGKIMGEPSLGLKYSFTSDIVLDAAINPDFSQIEADAAQIDVNSPIALFYGERRPYFQEGSDIFRTLFNSFYTRSINDPIFTAKLTTRRERTTVGFVSAYDETSPYVVPLEEGTITINGGESFVNILRGLRSIGDDTHVGFIVSDRRFKNNGSGTVVGVDGDIRLSRNYSIDGQFLLTHTQEPDDDSRFSFFEGEAPVGYTESDVNAVFNEYYCLPRFADSAHTFAFDGESYSGTGFITRFRRSARHLNFTLDYNQVSPSYRTQVGFDPYMDYRNFSIASSYTFYSNKGVIERITPQIYTLSRWNFDGIRRLQMANVSVSCQTKLAQSGFNVHYSVQEEMYGNVLFDNMRNTGFDFDATPLDQVSFATGFDIGRGLAYSAAARGNQISAYAAMLLKPIDRLVIEPRANYLRSKDAETGEEQFEQFILRARVRLQMNKFLSLRLVTQYNHRQWAVGDELRTRKTWEVDPLLTYRLGSFTVFYLGSTSDMRYIDMQDQTNRWRVTGRQFFMKIQYLFQA